MQYTVAMKHDSQTPVETLVREYLVANPGEHRPVDIAKGINSDRATTHRVAHSLYALAERGVVSRVVYQMPTKKGTYLKRGKYAANEKTPTGKPTHAFQ